MHEQQNRQLLGAAAAVPRPSLSSSTVSPSACTPSQRAAGLRLHACAVAGTDTRADPALAPLTMATGIVLRAWNFRNVSIAYRSSLSDPLRPMKRAFQSSQSDPLTKNCTLPADPYSGKFQPRSLLIPSGSPSHPYLSFIVSLWQIWAPNSRAPAAKSSMPLHGPPWNYSKYCLATGFPRTRLCRQSVVTLSAINEMRASGAYTLAAADYLIQMSGSCIINGWRSSSEAGKLQEKLQRSLLVVYIHN